MPVIPDTPDPTTIPRRHRWVAVVLGAALVLGGITAAVIIGEDDPPSRQEIVAERGAAVMPFDLEATTHVFDATATGGIQTVTADDPRDRTQVELIRTHLRHEVDRFRAGDFGDPAAIHGHDMPGLATLEAKADDLQITYRDLPDGGEVTFLAELPTTIAALHDWFDAQLSDHGSHARMG